MKKLLVLSFILIFAFGSFAFSADMVRLGAINNLTGAQASIDVPTYNGMKLAVKLANEKGGVLGMKIRLYGVDAKTDQTAAANGTRKLIDVNKVVAIAGFSDTDYALAAGAVAQKAGIPFVTSGATHPEIPKRVGDFMFMAAFGDNVQAYAGAEFAYKKLGAKKAWLLKDSAMEYTMTLAKYMKERFEKLGGKILLEDTYQTGDTDYSSQIARLKNLKDKPDVLFVAAGPDDCGLIVKQLREAGIFTPVIGGDGFDTPLLVELAGPKFANDVFFTTHISYGNKSKIVQNFINDYKKEYGHEPESAFAALGYDAIGLIINAIGKANSLDPKAIRDALAATKGYQGVTGTISYKPGDRVPTKSVTIIRVKDGKFVFEAEVLPQ